MIIYNYYEYIIMMYVLFHLMIPTVPCMPRNVQIIVCSVVIWEAPICPNGVIRYYEMIFWNSADDFKNITVIGIKVFHILLPDEKKYKVLQVRE